MTFVCITKTTKWQLCLLSEGRYWEEYIWKRHWGRKKACKLLLQYCASSAPGEVQHSIQVSAESGASVLYSDTQLLMSKVWPFVFYYVCPRSPPLCPRYTALLPQQQTERKRQTSGAAAGDEWAALLWTLALSSTRYIVNKDGLGWNGTSFHTGLMSQQNRLLGCYRNTYAIIYLQVSL